MSWSEQRMHRWIARELAPSRTVGSVGHDAAVLGVTKTRTVCCVDQTVEGVHFRLDAAARAVGRKACARALSDLAATAARPRAVLLALSVPPEREERWLRGALRGVAQEAELYGAELVGGDLCASPGPSTLSVSAIGELDGRCRAPGRDRARVGDRVVISGPCGGSGLGRHLSISPRVDEGCALHAHGARAMMDVSDGLALDLWRVAQASGVRIELEACPVHRDARRAARESGRDPRWHALHDGEDHELIATLAPAAAVRACAAIPGLVEIGRVRMGAGLRLGTEVTGAAHPRAWRPSEGGYRHGG